MALELYGHNPWAKIKSSVFGQPAFSNLSIRDQAQYVLAHVDDQNLSVLENRPFAIESMRSTSLDYLATILLRATCGCQLFGVYLDESTRTVEELELNHDPECMNVRLPIIEDRSESTLRRRQRQEVLAAPETLVLLEEEANNISGKRER